MDENKPQGAEGTDGTVEGEDSSYQLAVSLCREHMTAGKKDDAVDAYNEAIAINTDAENEELSLLSEQLDVMEEGTAFEFPESETTEETTEAANEGSEAPDPEKDKEENKVEETNLESLPEWHDKAGQQLETDELKKILKEELGISFNMLTGRNKLQKKFDDYNAEKGYVKSEEDVKAEESKDEEDKTEKSTVKKDKRGRKAKTVTLDDCIEDCQKAVMTLQQMEKQERANGKSSRRFRRAWQTINGQVIKKSLRRK